MNFAKTFCKPSAAVSVVPAGLPIKLQYNEHGVLQTFRIGFTPNLDPMYKGVAYDTSALLNKIKGFVPQSVPVKGGTTWVFGVLYSDNVPTVEGEIPKGLYSSYIADILKGGRYEFYAGYAKSLAAQFSGSLIIRNFLTSAKFNLLPQVIVPASMSNQSLDLMMDGSYPFNKPFISGYIIFEDLNCRYVSDVKLQVKVSNDPKLFVDSDGFWKAEVVSEAGEKFIFNYSSIIHNNIKKGSILLAEKSSNGSSLSISATRLKSGAQLVPTSTPESVKCPICNKVNMLGVNNVPNQCDDPHCLSHQYTDVVKMLKVLKLPELLYPEYLQHVENKEITCLTDVLHLPQYKDIEINATMAQAIDSVVPVTVVPNAEIFERFANKCSNSVETVNYYLNNPLHIETDLDIIDPIVRRFVTWVEDPYNASTISTILDIVKIAEKVQKFDGDPIFRGNTFIITGKFKRGDYHEICSILQSYSADVMSNFEQGKKLPDLVITGSLNDGISGQIIQKARIHNIPVADEDAFFSQYEIDDDLARNLL